jgi:PD-(D/E)XK nuclease superfamily
MSDLLTHSRMQAFRACPRKHEIRYVLGFVPIDTPWAFAFGTIMHSLIERYWLWRKQDKEFLADINTFIPEKTDPYEAVKIRLLFEAYMAVWNTTDVEVVDVEKEFRLPLNDPNGRPTRWTRAGKIDLILRIGGQLVCCDHKTSSVDVGPGSDFRRRLTLDEQLSFYETAMAALGMRPDYFIYDVIQKPRIDPLSATPIEARKYTQESSRACKVCKKKNSPPPPHLDEETGVACKGGRVVTDPGGKLYANMREFDETPAEYEKRLIKEILDNPTGYIERIEVHRSREERANFAKDVWQQAQMMSLAMEMGLAPRNSDACLKYGSPCAYMDVCEGTRDLKNQIYFRKLKHLHPELSDDAAK